MRAHTIGRWRALIVTLAVTASALVAPAVAQAKAPNVPDVPGQCNGQYRTSQQWKADVSGVAADRVLVYDGVKIKLTPSGWRYYNGKDPAQTLWFHSLNWVAYLALSDPKTAIDVLVEADKALPDPGRYGGKYDRQATGWTQGAFRTRLETVTCLWYLTSDKRIIPVAEKLAEANMDPARYPGPPYNAVQNHGAMSNIALYQAGKAFERDDWIEYALKRLTNDMPEVFEPCGMMWEQSSTYQAHNVALWSKATRILGDEFAGPETALGALVRPDGVLESIGDGQPASGLTPNGKTLWCRQTGWAAGTLRDDTLGPAHYTLRFGPSNDDHGHFDHMSVTWFAAGVPVLSDRGLFDKQMGKRRTYAQGSTAHSMLLPSDVTRYDAYTSAERIGLGGGYHLTDSDGYVQRDRTVTFGTSALHVVDVASGAKNWVQHWQLAPGWTPTVTGAVYEDGTTLAINCAKWKAVQVEAYPAWRTVAPAWDLQCYAKAYDVTFDTTLTVSPPAATDDTTS